MLAGRRLLVVTESLGIGGTESHLIRLSVPLAAQGWNTAIYCLSEPGPRANQVEAAGIRVFSSPWPRRPRSTWARSPASIALAAKRLFWLMRRWRPHIVHFYLPGPYLVGAPLALAAGVPVKIMSRRSLSDYQRNWPIVARLERLLHGRMDALIGNSRAVVAQLMDEGGIEGKVRLIYNGIDAGPPPASRSEARRALGLDESALIGVMVANLIHYKGHEDLIRGLGQVASALPSPWQVLLAGRDHGLLTKLQGLAAASGIADNIRYLGQRNDVPQLLAAADFGLLTSHEEGFSNVILEGMAAALPMIVTDVGGNPEAVLHEQTGLVIPAHDPAAIAGAVLRLARDPDLRKRLGAAGRDRVKREFSIGACAAAHSQLYEELLAEHDAKTIEATRAEANRVHAGASLPRGGATHGGAYSRRPLMLAYWGRYGALPQLTLELAEACRRSGEDSETTISISTSNELFGAYASFGEGIFPVVTYSSALSAANAANVFKLRRRLTDRLLADGTRAFVTLMPHVWSPLIADTLRQARVRHTVIVHDAEPHEGDHTAIINRWLLREAKSADQVVTLTSAVAERLAELNVVPRSKISVLFHPDLTFPLNARRSPGDALRVLFFGRILPYKGLSQFVTAMELLRSAGITVEIGVFGAGEMGPEMERLRRLDAEVVNEWIDPADIAGILGRYDVMVVSHISASQSGVIAAAHGAGLPVVATPVGGLREQIVPEVTGILSGDTTAQAIAAALKRFVDSPELLQCIRQGISATRRERSVDRFFSVLREVALKDA